ncbi:MAG: adenylate kinase [Bacteroidales bacterium]|nr:adenylate kinase [Bacteroidales bacterium]
MLNLVIFGPPGSGKGTQSARIVEQYKLTHVSTGDMFRHEMEEQTPLGMEVRKFIDRGLLVPDDIVLKMLYQHFCDHADVPGFIFDGFPRTIVQAKALDDLLEERHMPIGVVVSVEVKEEELYKRISGRGEDSGRSDDSEKIVRKRLAVYKDQTMPLLDYYDKQGKIAAINGMAPVDEVFAKIRKAVDTYVESNRVLPVVD